MKLRLLFLMFFVYAQAYSQYEYRPGYIVKPDSTIEEGLINSHGSEFNAKKCEFKKDANASPVVYLPGELAAYRLADSKYFVSKKITIDNSEMVLFLECLISGKATIYYTKWNSKDHYYLEKEDTLTEIDNNMVDIIQNGETYQHPSHQYVGILKYYFRDCPPVVQKLDHTDFSKKSLINISKEYHEYVCKDEQCIIYEKKYPKKRIQLGVDFIYGKTKLEFSQNFGNISMNPISYVQFDINSQIKLDEEGAFNLQASLGYYSYKNELLNNTTVLTSVSAPNDVYYEFSILKPEVQLKYKIRTWKILPFASAGVFSSIFLKDKGELYSHNFHITVPFTSIGLDESTTSMNGMIGTVGEIGFETGLKPGNLSLSLVYEYYLTNPMKSSYNMGIKCGYSFYIK